jgi:hypothetical protein
MNKTVFKLTEELQSVSKKHLKLFKQLEWSGIVMGPGNNMGDTGDPVGCCPCCGGIDPDDPISDAYSKVGHTGKCKLAKYIRDCIKRIDD